VDMVHRMLAKAGVEGEAEEVEEEVVVLLL
jgi:hypothetical protein